MARIVVDTRVRLALGDLSFEQADAVRAAATHRNPNYGKPRHEGEPQTIKTWSHEGDDLTVPRGLLERVEVLLGVGRNPGSVQVEMASFEDGRTWSNPEPDFPDHRFVLRDYQEDLVDAMGEFDDGLFRAPTGSGKTTAGYASVARVKRRTLVMVWSGALLKQWRERALEELGMNPDDVGHVQGDRETIRPLTLGMQQTFTERFKRGAGDLPDAFDYLLCDEVQRFAAPTLQAAVEPFTARKRQGISADETRHDGFEFLTYGLFGPVRCEIPKERVLASGAVVPVEVAVVPTKFVAPWYRFRRDFNKLLDQMSADAERNALLLSLIRSAVASGEQVLVFTHRVEHARWIDGQVAQMGIPGGLMLGGVEQAAEFDRTKAKIKAGVLRVATGTYKAISAGIDVPAVGRGIAATPFHNNRQEVNQVMGRLCRSAKGKTHARLAYLSDVAVYGYKPVRNFVSWFPYVRVWDGRAWVVGKEFLARAA